MNAVEFQETVSRVADMPFVPQGPGEACLTQRRADIRALLMDPDYDFRVTALRSADTLVVSKTHVAKGMLPLPNLAGLIEQITTFPFQHADQNSSRPLADLAASLTQYKL
jgi:hypothetical protein